MDHNAQRFLDAYATIENVFESWNKTGQNVGFSQYVIRYANSNMVVRKYRDDLLEFAQLRNAIVHERVNRHEIIATPHLQVVEEIEKIATLLSTPPKIKDLPLRYFVSVQLDETLVSVLKKLKDHGYQQLPVIANRKVLGILTTAKIMNGLLNRIRHSHIELSNILVSELLVKANDFHCVDENMSVFEALNLFMSAYESGVSLVGLVVLKNHVPIGLITYRDLPMLIAKTN